MLSAVIEKWGGVPEEPMDLYADLLLLWAREERGEFYE